MLLTEILLTDKFRRQSVARSVSLCNEADLFLSTKSVAVHYAATVALKDQIVGMSLYSTAAMLRSGF